MHTTNADGGQYVNADEICRMMTLYTGVQKKVHNFA